MSFYNTALLKLIISSLLTILVYQFLRCEFRMCRPNGYYLLHYRHVSCMHYVLRQIRPCTISTIWQYLILKKMDNSDGTSCRKVAKSPKFESLISFIEIFFLILNWVLMCNCRYKNRFFLWEIITSYAYSSKLCRKVTNFAGKLPNS